MLLFFCLDFFSHDWSLFVCTCFFFYVNVKGGLCLYFFSKQNRQMIHLLFLKFYFNDYFLSHLFSPNDSFTFKFKYYVLWLNTKKHMWCKCQINRFKIFRFGLNSIQIKVIFPLNASSCVFTSGVISCVFFSIQCSHGCIFGQTGVCCSAIWTPWSHHFTSSVSPSLHTRGCTRSGSVSVCFFTPHGSVW